MTAIEQYCPLIIVVAVGFTTFWGLWMAFWLPRQEKRSFYFDPQDYCATLEDKSILPKGSETGTFEPLLKSYIEVVKLLVTIAAASIAFGSPSTTKTPLPIAIAKLCLAWSIFTGVMFIAFLLYRYDEYTNDIHSYTPKWYATIFAFGFSSLLGFIIGYAVWAFGLLKA